MSTFVPVVVTCPSCGARREVQLAESINASRTPEHRDWILQDGFQVFACACGTTTLHQVDLIYIDFDAKLYVGVLRPELEADWAANEREPAEAFDQNLGDLGPEHTRSIGWGFRVRTVFGLPALREKLRCDDARLDDVALEILKLRLLLTSGRPAATGSAWSRPTRSR